MYKLLKLVAIGALLAVGPIQAFAAVDDFPLSDEIQIFNGNELIVDFRFDDRGNSEHLLDPVKGTPSDPAWNGGAQAQIYTLHNVTNRDTTSSNWVLSLSESDGSISDTLWAQFKTVDNETFANIYFFDPSPPPHPNNDNHPEPPGDSITNLNGDPILEDSFNGKATLFLGLGTQSGFTVLFASDPGVLNAIPEPEIYAMMGIGLALMGFVARRKRELQDRAAT